MSTNPTKRIEEIDRRLEELPKGTLTYKKIKGKEQPYIQRTKIGFAAPEATIFGIVLNVIFYLWMNRKRNNL